MVNSERTVTFLQECSEDYLDHVRDLPAERCSVSTGWRMVHYHEKFISGTNLQNIGIKEDKPKKKKKWFGGVVLAMLFRFLKISRFRRSLGDLLRGAGK